MNRLRWPLALLTFCVLTFAARCWNPGSVFVAGGIYFVDADCYSRMTRAALVEQGQGWVIRRHDFENYPTGTTPHTTAPLDWLIVAGKRIVDAGLRMADWSGTSVLRGQSLDLSGALISPLLGVLTCAWLGWWARRQRIPELPLAHAWTAPLLFAISPVLVHGTGLGRPDHQSFLILVLSVALGLEWHLWMRSPGGRGTLAPHGDTGRGTARPIPSPTIPLRLLGPDSLIAGVAWALAMWVSLYEPLVIFLTVVALWLVGDRRRFTGREFRAGWIAFGAILVGAVLIDGWRVVWPEAGTRAAFAQWQTTIGELRHLDLRTATVLEWLGAVCVISPLLLGLAVRRDRKMSALPALLLLLLALTLWQLRWGYFLALVFAMSLPWQLAVFPRPWLAGAALFLGLWPMARAWDAMLFPDSSEEKAREVRSAENVKLREVALRMRAPERQAFLAPWWLSPALAYWSGQPGVAGSSHQALPGTMESARFFLAPDAATAEAVAHRVGVKWIVTDGLDADGVSRLVKAYAPLLGGAVPEAPWGVAMHERGRPREQVSADDLRDAPPELRAKLLALTERAEIEALGSAAFTCVFRTDFFKLFRVK